MCLHSIVYLHGVGCGHDGKIALALALALFSSCLRDRCFHDLRWPRHFFRELGARDCGSGCAHWTSKSAKSTYLRGTTRRSVADHKMRHDMRAAYFCLRRLVAVARHQCRRICGGSWACIAANTRHGHALYRLSGTAPMQSRHLRATEETACRRRPTAIAARGHSM